MEQPSNPYGLHLLLFGVLIFFGPLFLNSIDDRAAVALTIAAGVTFYLTWFLYGQWNRENRKSDPPKGPPASQS